MAAKSSRKSCVNCGNLFGIEQMLGISRYDVSFLLLKAGDTKIRLIWFKSDFFDLNQFCFLSNHIIPLQVNQSRSAQSLRIANANNAIKIKEFYIQMKQIDKVIVWKSEVNEVFLNDEIQIRYKWPIIRALRVVKSNKELGK